MNKMAYDELASRLEQELNVGSRIEWYVDRYDARLGDACISEEAAKALGTTPDAHFDQVYKHLAIWTDVNIECEKLRHVLDVTCTLVEAEAVDYVAIIKRLVADNIASKLIESETGKS